MAFERRYDGTEPQRVNKWLAQSGVCSRREAEGLIAEGLVTIDGERVDDPGRKILPGQSLVLADKAERKLQGRMSILLHKPRGIVSAHPEPGQTPAVRLLTRDRLWGPPAAVPGVDGKLAPVGRLDLESRGLLVLSEDGVLAKALIGPESVLEKEYWVFVMGEITEDKLDLLRHGLELDGRQLRPAEVEMLADQRLRFVLREGRNRQIRRMCELVELKVVDLFRMRVGPLTLGKMPEGRWRHITDDERALLVGAGME
jgi:23S rRNA pseudouridine2604 synthase